jgi:hypothetical protein
MNRFGDIDCSFKKLPAVFGYHVQQIVSLEKSLEQIQNQILGLDYFIKVAKRRCHFPSEDGVTRDQSASIHIYLMESALEPDRTGSVQKINRAGKNRKFTGWKF